MDFDDEGAEEPDAEAWETEDDEGVEDGMEAQDDSEVTFSLHSGAWWARAAAAGVLLGTCSHPGLPQSKGVQQVLARLPSPGHSRDSRHDSGLPWAVIVSTLRSGREVLRASYHGGSP